MVMLILTETTMTTAIMTDTNSGVTIEEARQRGLYVLPMPVIIDGNDRDRFVERVLQKECPLFNSAQYLVEHCRPEKHVIVQASAGTGKTTVMIDRIMYLLHTQPDLHLAEVFMITFTNDAAEQMSQRLQDALMTRYSLTGNQRYLRWLEEQSHMNVSTMLAPGYPNHFAPG